MLHHITTYWRVNNVIRIGTPRVSLTPMPLVQRPDVATVEDTPLGVTPGLTEVTATTDPSTSVTESNSGVVSAFAEGEPDWAQPSPSALSIPSPLLNGEDKCVCVM